MPPPDISADNEGMTDRDEILEVVRVLARRRPDGSFSVEEIVAELRRRDPTCSPGAVRRHVNGGMCSNAPAELRNYPDLERLERGWFRLARTEQTPDRSPSPLSSPLPLPARRG